MSVAAALRESLRDGANRRAWAWLAAGFIGAAIAMYSSGDEDDDWDERAPMVLLVIACFACVGRGVYVASARHREPGIP
jgi:hypothetical protein